MYIYAKSLNEINKDSLPEAGGKGANLGELIHAGIPVPPGFVVTANAYRAHLEASKLQDHIARRLENLKEQDITGILEASEDISAWIEETPMPMPVQEDVSRAFESLGLDENLSVAVRSSATAEDLPNASFAGQHDTFLGIYGKNAVLKYVKKCWLSLWTSQAIAYRISMGFEHLKVDLAVVVQAMIASEAAGVMFTANPVSGNCDEILVSAGYGLGEAVVSGLITPDTFIMTKEGSIKQKVLGSKEYKIMLTEKGTITEKSTITEECSKEERESYCIWSNELQQLVNLANLVEKHYGSPMDTEWGLSKGKVYLLQARPITTMKSKAEDLNILGPGERIIYQGKKAPLGLKSVIEHSPYPHAPLDFACFRYFYEGASSQFLDMGFKLPKEKNKPMERESGCVALSYHPPEPSPAIIWKMPKTLIKSLFRDTDVIWQTVSKEMDAWMNRMDATLRITNDTEKLIKLFEQAMKEYSEFVIKRFSSINTPGGITDIKFGRLIKKAVGKEKADEFKERLMRALPFRTALQNKALAKLAQAAIKGKDSKAFKDELENFLGEYGDRPSTGMGRMISPPTWREKPKIIHEIINALSCDPNILNSEKSFKKQEDDYEAAKKIIKEGLRPGEYHKFLKILDKVRNSVIIREESVFYLEKLAACLHQIAIKLGGLLVKQLAIREVEDVFFIFLDELTSVAEGKLDVKVSIEKRKKMFEKVYAAHERGVHWMISTGSFPVFETKKEKSKDEIKTSDSLKGVSASRGVCEGTVCIVRGPGEFNKLKKGDILVSTYTAPVWTPLFRVASAAVTEIGSPTSHAAIVAREYGIPAVVAIENVTNILRDGQRIRVDGTKGIITLLQEVQDGGVAHV